jgi:hypothetical protein
MYRIVAGKLEGRARFQGLGVDSRIILEFI